MMERGHIFVVNQWGKGHVEEAQILRNTVENSKDVSLLIIPIE